MCNNLIDFYVIINYDFITYFGGLKMSEVNKKIQDYLATNHNDLFNDDLKKEKQDVNDLLFNLFGSEISSADKKAYIRKQKANYLKSKQASPGADSKEEIKKEIKEEHSSEHLELQTNVKTDYDNNIITLLQDTLNQHSLKFDELQKRIDELEHKSKEEIKTIQPQQENNNNLLSQISKNDLLDTEKTRYTFYITNNNIEYLKAFCKENNNISITSVINFMINSFKNNYPVISETPETPKPKKLF